MTPQESDDPRREGEDPLVSFGLPVRNGGELIRRCLDSLLAQDMEDFEILISDNASTDGTQDVIREYAASDPRIRPLLNKEDVGQIENFNNVVRHARGRYFRWIGAEDWLEPNYASRCSAVLDDDPDTIVVTNFFRIHIEGGETRYEEFEDELLESERPERRFARLSWSFRAGASLYEPLYSLIRRDVLLDTSLIRMMVKADRLLAAELCLSGRFHHIRECLAHRWKPPQVSVHSSEYLRRYRPDNSAELQSNAWRQFRVLVSIIWGAPLSTAQKLRCLGSALGFFVTEQRIQLSRRSQRMRRRLGISREGLRRLRR